MIKISKTNTHKRYKNDCIAKKKFYYICLHLLLNSTYRKILKISRNKQSCLRSFIKFRILIVMYLQENSAFKKFYL